MVGRSVRAGAVVALGLIIGPAIRPAGNPARADVPEGPDRQRLRAHVAALAAPEFGGRRGAGARKAETYVCDHFRALGLEPLFPGASFTQDVPDRDSDAIIGRNVGAVLRGSDPARRDEWVLLSAHYDHLGVRNGVLYPGADDNASGVAMLLEVARCLADAPERLRRGVMFVAFALAEDGLLGSRHFVARPPVPLETIKLFLTADLIGGALGGVCRSQIFVLGSEHAPGLRAWIDRAAALTPLNPALVGSDMLLVSRSDYGPFRARKVPYLFFSTGESPRYHTPDDTPESLDYPKLEAISRIMGEVVRQAARADTVPGWTDTPDYPLAEAVAVRDVFRTLMDHRDALRIQGAQMTLMARMVERLDAIIRRGRITPDERGQMVRTAQIILMTVL